MRFVIGVVLALSVGVGAYLGSAQVADSAKTPPRTVTLRSGDIAAIGHYQCRGVTYGERHPVPNAYLLCSVGPLSRAAESVEVFGDSVSVEKKVGHVQCFWQSPRPEGPHPPGPSTPHPTPYFSENLRCLKGPRTYVNGSMVVLPRGIAFFKRRTMVYRTGWGKR